MRTTLRIDDDLLRELKERAQRAEQSLSTLTNQIIRQGLAAAPKSSQKRYREKTFNMGKPKVDITKALSLAFALEDEDLIRKMKLRP